MNKLTKSFCNFIHINDYKDTFCLKKRFDFRGKYVQEVVLCEDVFTCNFKNSRFKITKFFDKTVSAIQGLDETGGMPLVNEYLEALKERDIKIVDKYKDDEWEQLKLELLEVSDDIFDSKGDDISEKDFLNNEMENYD